MRTLGRIATAGLICVAAATFNANAQDTYPNRPVRIVVPVAPGGGPDLIARLVADRLTLKWKQPVTVENRPGAALNLAAEFVAKAPADGYTLLATPPGPLAINQHVFSNLRYEPAAFTPLTIMAAQSFVLVAGSSVPAADLPQVVAHAKANPGKLTFGSPGIGSPPHLAGELLKAKAGVNLTHVTYKGMPMAFADLLGGRLDLMFWEMGSVIEHIRSGKIKALGVSGTAPQAELPGVPVISQVIPEVIATTWFALAAPPHTPPAVSSKISTDVAEILRANDVVQRLRDFHATPVGSNSADTLSFIRTEIERWRGVTEAAGIKAQ